MALLSEALADRPISANSLEGVCNNLTQRVNALYSTLEKTREIADRLLGTEDAGARHGAPAADPVFSSGMLGELQSRDHEIMQVTSSIAYQLGRIAAVVL